MRPDLRFALKNDIIFGYVRVKHVKADQALINFRTGDIYDQEETAEIFLCPDKGSFHGTCGKGCILQCGEGE